MSKLKTTNVWLVERNRDYTIKRRHEFRTDTKVKNVFTIELDSGYEVRVEINPKKWWEFWR